MPVSFHSPQSSWRALVPAVALLLAACGGGSGGGGSHDGEPPVANTATLEGTAAVGAAIHDAVIVAKCADGSGFTGTVRTEANGAWSGTVSSAALPCALQLSGGAPAVTLHGYAARAGTVNITPLTDLALALATSSLPADWFASAQPAAPALASAVPELEAALELAGYDLPAGNFAPFTTPFGIGDDWDVLLDKLGEAIGASAGIADYQALVALVSGGNLASLPGPVSSTPDPDPVGHPAVSRAPSFNLGSNGDSARAAMAGSYDVAIYTAPTVAQTGLGKLVIAYADDTLTLTLKDAAGTELVKRSGKKGNDYSAGTINLDDRYAADPAQVYTSDSTSGWRTGVYNYYQGGNSTGPGSYFSVNVFSNGVIAGSTGGFFFRNEVQSYGGAIPGVFATLAGQYGGATQQVSCGNPNPVTVAITVAGAVTTGGKPSVSCTAETVSASWDGIQDLVVPLPEGGKRLLLDAPNRGGSLPGGGYVIDIDGEQVTKLFLPFAGMAGDITSVNLVR